MNLLSHCSVAHGDGGVPAVEEVEFAGDLISHSHWCSLGGVDFWTTGTGSQNPGIVGTISGDDCTEVVVKNDVDI
jgi:hypothetical protein